MNTKIIIIRNILNDIKLFSNIDVVLSENSEKELGNIMKYQEYKKHETICNIGDVCDKISYVQRGLIRQFYYKKEKDITENFADEGKFFANIESYIKKEPSRLKIEALEFTSTFYFEHDAIEDLANQNPEIQYLYRCMFASALIFSQIKADSFRNETARERYERFVKIYPEIIKKAPLQYIASYLAMTKESISRVRAGKL